MPTFNVEAIVKDVKEQQRTALDLSEYLRPEVPSPPSLPLFFERGFPSSVYSLTVLPDGRLACGGAYNNIIELWDISTRTCVATLTGHTKTVRSLTMLPDGRLASGSMDESIKLWDIRTHTCVATFTVDKYFNNVLTVLSDGGLASGSMDRSIKLWDIRTRTCVATLTGHTKQVYSLTVLPDSRLASGSDDNSIKLWDIRSQKCVATLTGHTNSVISLTMLPDGRLVSGSMDKSIKLWDIRTHTCVATLTGHTSAVMSLTVLPDGRLTSGAADGSIKLWNISTRTCVANLTGHTSNVLSLTVLPDGRLASGSFDERDYRSIKLWNVMSTLTLTDLRPLFVRLKDTVLQSISLQKTKLLDTDTEELALLFRNISQINQLDVRQTDLSNQGVLTFYLALKKHHPKIQLLHDAGPTTYRGLFEKSLKALQDNPTDKQAQTGLVQVIRTSHEQMIATVNEAMAHPELMSPDMLGLFFEEVCYLTDFRWPYTLLNVLLAPGNAPLTSAERESLMKTLYSTLSWLAQHAILDSDGIAAFKGLLRSVYRKRFITSYQRDKLDNEAEVSRVFADSRFIELKGQIRQIQSQLLDLKKEIQQVDDKVHVVQNQVRALANDVNNLKTAMKRKAERAAVFGVMKSVLSFVMAAGLAEALQAVWDHSDLMEVSSSLFNVDEERFKALLDSGKDKLAEHASETLIQKVGYDPEQFIEEWHSLSVSWVNISQGKAEAPSPLRLIEPLPPTVVPSVKLNMAHPISSGQRVYAEKAGNRNVLFSPTPTSKPTHSPYADAFLTARQNPELSLLFHPDTELSLTQNKKEVTLSGKKSAQDLVEPFTTWGEILAKVLSSQITEWDVEQDALKLVFKTSNYANAFAVFTQSPESGLRFEMDQQASASLLASYSR